MRIFSLYRIIFVSSLLFVGILFVLSLFSLLSHGKPQQIHRGHDLGIQFTPSPPTFRFPDRLNYISIEGFTPVTFEMTAYYSPLRNQPRYNMGNYSAEIRLNGRGTNGADGTEVYLGMIAAPRSYPFGTLIYIPDLGLFTVHDRGGAIRSTSEGEDYDRLDIWMGKGEVARVRANTFGRRTLSAYIVDPEMFAFDLPQPSFEGIDRFLRP